ncbi:MAG: hydantoinase/oxoprolinase family protein, partial [Chloroflexi bacterium]|nr:hydantoinase/oxoprolinase family protein [Chloroflexota bacterium]
MPDGDTSREGSATYTVAIDIGGTFTDLVMTDESGRTLHTLKVLTTPDDPSQGALNALASILASTGTEPQSVRRLIHATTLATNLILERKGAAVAYVTTEGFGDLLAIGKESRVGEQRYDLAYQKPLPPVSRAMTVEVRERMNHRGKVLTPLDEAEARRRLARLRKEDVEAVAICLLHSYANPEHERQVAGIVRECLPDAYVALSSEVWPEFREYDRAMTTVLSAHVGPLMARYTKRMEDGARRLGVSAPLQIMQSNGGVMSVSAAVSRPIASIESGPAAGVIAAAHLGRLLGHENVISFDMGGTTAKAGLIRQGQPQIRNDFYVGGGASAAGRGGGMGFLVKTPVIDLAEVGSGGGSIARVDQGGVIQVGPDSAGARPGPACYGLGGVEPTVTDAAVALGYLDPNNFLGGKMRIDAGQARRAIERSIAEPLGMTVEEAASGIMAIADATMAIADATMASAIRLVTVQRGIDPREFHLVAFGGAGPAHIVHIAEEFGIPSVIVPPHPGLASSMGLLIGDVMRDVTRTQLMELGATDAQAVEAVFQELEEQAREQMGAASDAPSSVRLLREIDMRYRLQSHEIAVPLTGGAMEPAVLGEAFERMYEERYGLRQQADVQLVNFRVRAVASSANSPFREVPPGDGDPTRASKGTRLVYFHRVGGSVDATVYTRADLLPKDRFAGPAIVEEAASTTVVPP